MSAEDETEILASYTFKTLLQMNPGIVFICFYQMTSSPTTTFSLLKVHEFLHLKRG